MGDKKESFYHPTRLSCQVDVLKGQEKEKKKETPIWAIHVWNQSELMAMHNLFTLMVLIKTNSQIHFSESAR